MQMPLKTLKLIVLVWLGVLVTGIAVILMLYAWAWVARAIRSRRAHR
jgi:hypothetical protein